ncbi:MAG TPA: exopolysaccharide biosynthesis protein [Alphaproteobacteria bacterium]|nr:exopolysaccharide biosynthesis protein [Alphaproteobacteria bacterium]
MTSDRPHSKRVSEILSDIARSGDGDGLELHEILAVLGDRAYGVMMLVLSLPNAIGLGAIPGLSTIFGVPQIILAAQMIFGRKQLWLPRPLLDRSIPRRDFVRVVDKAMPYLEKVERILRPRWENLAEGVAERLLGVAFLILAVVVSLPIAFGNQPPAVAMALLALGMIERDGAFVIAGLVSGVIALAIASTVVVASIAAVFLLMRYLFGA